MPQAIVTGATGILGREIVYELAKDQKQWPKIHALSRSQKEAYPANVIHDRIDLTASASDMAKQLQGVQAEYLFFAAYLAGNSEQEMYDTNSSMLRNFLRALRQTGAIKHLKRVVLTTGAKQYGVHLGKPKQPMEESDPWLTGADRPPNFYYGQQDVLKEESAADNASWDWVVTFPNDVLGVAKNNFMNLVTSLGLYCAVTKELGQPLVFPGSETFYTCFDCFTSAKLHAQFNAWVALQPKASNQAFNVVNGDVESWQNMWPKLAHRFGLQVPPNMFQLDVGKDAGSLLELAERPPLAEAAVRAGLVGSREVVQAKVEQRIDMVKWSQRPDVKKAWEALAAREGLEKEAFEEATWAFLGFVLGRNFDIVISMSKARAIGWTGYMDTFSALEDCLTELEAEKVLPKRR